MTDQQTATKTPGSLRAASAAVTLSTIFLVAFFFFGVVFAAFYGLILVAAGAVLLMTIEARQTAEQLQDPPSLWAFYAAIVLWIAWFGYEMHIRTMPGMSGRIPVDAVGISLLPGILTFIAARTWKRMLLEVIDGITIRVEIGLDVVRISDIHLQAFENDPHRAPGLGGG